MMVVLAETEAAEMAVARKHIVRLSHNGRSGQGLALLGVCQRRYVTNIHDHD